MLTGGYPPDASTTVLGAALSMPIMVAPWAYQRMAAPHGELATARAAERAGTLMVVSSTTFSYLEDVAQASGGPKWWQLYVFTDRGVSEEILHRVHAAGY